MVIALGAHSPGVAHGGPEVPQVLGWHRSPCSSISLGSQTLPLSPSRVQDSAQMPVREVLPAGAHWDHGPLGSWEIHTDEHPGWLQVRLGGARGLGVQGCSEFPHTSFLQGDWDEGADPGERAAAGPAHLPQDVLLHHAG